MCLILHVDRFISENCILWRKHERIDGIWFCLVVGLDIRPVFDLWVVSPSVSYWLASCCLWCVCACVPVCVCVCVWCSGQIQLVRHALLLFSQTLLT